MATPQTVTLTGTITWSDGTLFDGYVLLGLGLPSNATDVWPSLAVGAGKYPMLRLPIWTVVPIRQGVFDPNTKVFVNTSIDPPNSKYGAYWFDNNKRRIYPAAGVTAAPFTISASANGTYALTPGASLTLPLAPTTIPNAEDN